MHVYKVHPCIQRLQRQIEEKRYGAELLEKGFPAERIKKYGFAFKGKEVLIGQAAYITGLS